MISRCVREAARVFVQSERAQKDESEPAEPEAGVQTEFCERMSYL